MNTILGAWCRCATNLHLLCGITHNMLRGAQSSPDFHVHGNISQDLVRTHEPGF